MISLRSKITIKLLDYYFLNPEAKHYVNELANMFRMDPMNVYRKLIELEKTGLFKSEFKGKQRYFSLNNDYALLDQYRQIFLKTYGLENRLKSIMSETAGAKEAYIFGSYAKDKMDSSSDIDILVVGNHSVLELQREINKLQKDTGREFNVTSMSQKEFAERKKKKDPFLVNVLSGKTIKLL